MHPRQYIREKIKKILINKKTPACDRVYTNRDLPHWKTQLPAINILTDSESVAIYDQGPVKLLRKLDLKVVLSVKSKDTTDDDLDCLSSDVERALIENDFISEDEVIQEFNFTGMTFDQESLLRESIGRIVLSFEVDYFTYQGLRVEDLDDYKRDNINYEKYQATDSIERS